VFNPWLLIPLFALLHLWRKSMHQQRQQTHLLLTWDQISAIWDSAINNKPYPPNCPHLTDAQMEEVMFRLQQEYDKKSQSTVH
jgi:hypothetical protein